VTFQCFGTHTDFLEGFLLLFGATPSSGSAFPSEARSERFIQTLMLHIEDYMLLHPEDSNLHIHRHENMIYAAAHFTPQLFVTFSWG